MARTKTAVNMYLNKDIYLRVKAACETLESSVSEYVDDYLKVSVSMLETAARTNDFRAVGSAMGVQVAEFLSSAMRTDEGGEKAKKPKKRISKK